MKLLFWCSTRPRIQLWLLAMTGIFVFGCSSVPDMDPIDLRDPVIPLDARRLVADAQDGVAIARARREEARRNLRKTKKWRNANVEDNDWPAKAAPVVEKLSRLADARVELAELELEHSEAEYVLAQRKYALTTAKTAVRHDIAVYELKPLREQTEEALKEVQELNNEILDKREQIDKLTSAWWDIYQKYAKAGGDTRVFYVYTQSSEED